MYTGFSILLITKILILFKSLCVSLAPFDKIFNPYFLLVVFILAHRASKANREFSVYSLAPRDKYLNPYFLLVVFMIEDIAHRASRANREYLCVLLSSVR